MHSKIDNQNKIYYWHGILDPRGLSSDYELIIKKIIEGDYQGLDLEKLAGHHVYSVRVNDSNRLLLTTIIINGKPYLMLLDDVLNHDYAKSRFLKPAVLKNYLELHGKPISQELLSKHFEKQDNIVLLPPASSKNQGIEYSRIDFYNQKFIELDGTQLEIATTTTFPLIISGAPGSGKSCIALLILGQYVNAASTINDYPVLYVTESNTLASSMQRTWQSLPVAQNLAADAVQFKSYEQLVKYLVPQTTNMTFVDKNHCMTWLANYIQTDKKVRKTTKTNTLDNAVYTTWMPSIRNSESLQGLPILLFTRPLAKKILCSIKKMNKNGFIRHVNFTRSHLNQKG